MSRHLAVVGFAFVTSACASTGDPSMPESSASTSPGVSPSSGVSPSANLAGIVIGQSDPPEGMSHDTTVEGADALTQVVISGRDAEFLALPGFRDGRSNSFSGESGALLSIALAFDTPDDAAGALDLFLDELQSDDGYGFGAASGDAGLGDEGTCQEGANPALDDLQESICIWRHGDAVLIVGGPSLRRSCVRTLKRWTPQQPPRVARSRRYPDVLPLVRSRKTIATSTAANTTSTTAEASGRGRDRSTRGKSSFPR